MIDRVDIPWDKFKALINDKELSIQYVEIATGYLLILVDGPLTLNCVIPKTSPANVYQIDFEDNYKDNANQKIDKQEFANSDLRVTTVADTLITDNRIPVEATVIAQNSCPTLPNTFKIEYDGSNISCPSSYATLYTYSGSGLFHGAILDFNSDSVQVKLEIDGNIVFELTLEQIEDMQSFSSSGCNDNGGSSNNVRIVTKTSGNRLNIWFDCPIKYTSSIILSGQRTGNSNKTLDRKLVYIVKDV